MRADFTTTTYAVYIKGTLQNGRVLFESIEDGDDNMAVALTKDGKVYDLDACACLNVEQATFLRAHGIDTAGGAIDDE